MERLSAIVHAAVKNAPSGLSAEAGADLVGKKYKTLMSELARHDGHKPDMDLLPALVQATGSDAPLKHLARACGCLFIRVPDVAGAGHPLTAQLAEAVKDFGELMSTMGEALADGRIEHFEARRIARDGHDVMAAVMAVIRMAERAADLDTNINTPEDHNV